jgi:hypothetical protein
LWHNARNPCIFSDHNGVKLEINSWINYENLPNTWKLNNVFFND